MRGVLAAAYRGKDVAERALLRHVAILDGDGYAARTLCNRVPSESLADQDDGKATCPACLERFGRFVEGAGSR